MENKKSIFSSDAERELFERAREFLKRKALETAGYSAVIKVSYEEE